MSSLKYSKHFVNKISAVVKHFYHASFSPPPPCFKSQPFVVGQQHIPKLAYFYTESMYNLGIFE